MARRARSHPPPDQLTDEHERIAWFGAAELDELVWAHPEHRQLLQDVLSSPGH